MKIPSFTMLVASVFLLHITAAAAQTTITAPGTRIQTGPNGTRIEAPGVHIETGRGDTGVVVAPSDSDEDETPALSNSNITRGPSYSNASLEGMDFSNQDLRGVSFVNATLNGASFVNAQLEGADFTNAVLQNADFTNANLTSASFVNAKLAGANLTNANFTRANMTNAEIDGALIVGTIFTHTILTNVEMNKAIRTVRTKTVIITSSKIGTALTIDPKHPEQERKIDLTINFDFNSDKLTADGAKQVAEIAAALKSNSLATAHIMVEGHTDSIGSDKYNQDLSYRRATRVTRTLMEEHGIAANRLSSQGFGESRPVASNDNDLGRAKNRRVTLVNSGSKG